MKSHQTGLLFSASPRKAFLVVMAFLAASCADAEREERVEQAPRYRLAPVAEVVQEAQADFSWDHLTGMGPASGMVPAVGENSGRSFFDFRDGLEHPYYILKPEQQRSPS